MKPDFNQMKAMKFGIYQHGQHIQFKLRYTHQKANAIKAHADMKKYEKEFDMWFFKSGKAIMAGCVHHTSNFFHDLAKAQAKAELQAVEIQAIQLRAAL